MTKMKDTNCRVNVSGWSRAHILNTVNHLIFKWLLLQKEVLVSEWVSMSSQEGVSDRGILFYTAQACWSLKQCFWNLHEHQKSPGEIFQIETSGPHWQSFWFSRSDARPCIFAFLTSFRVMLMLLAHGPPFENCWSEMQNFLSECRIYVTDVL